MIARALLMIVLASVSIFQAYWIFRRWRELSYLKKLSEIRLKSSDEFISAIIPVRNDADIISKCLEKILIQEGVEYEVIVSDDCSNDGTLQIVREFEGVKIIKACPVPKGWVGKNWACVKGYEVSSGDVLIFMDSDTILHDKNVFLKTLSILNHYNVDVVSFYPNFRLETPWENIWIPFSANFIHILSPPSKVNEQNSLSSFLLGAFSAFRRATYERVGGHESVKGELAEDKALGERVKALGYRFLLAYGGDIISTKWGGGVRESWNSMKRVIPSSIKSRKGLLTALTILFTLFLLPPIVFLTSLLMGDVPTAALSAPPIILTALLQGMELRRNGGSLIYAICYPAAATFAILNLAYLMLKRRRVAVYWKGRRYEVRVSP